MQKPVSPPKFRRTCPNCNSPVEPGFKFCETCGTQMPELPTCSICGAEFIAPTDYCDWCGAPVILEEVPEPDDSPKYSKEESPGPVEDQASEHDEEKIPEPDTYELPEENDEETTVPADEETPHHYNEENKEPDTDALLEEFGKEYDEDETLGSAKKPKSPHAIKHEAKRAVTDPARRKGVSSETVDDALFFSPGKTKRPVKSQVNRTWIIGGSIVLIAIIVAVYFIGLPMLTGNGGAANVTPTPEPTIAVTITPTLTVTPTPVSHDLVPLPTQRVPSDQKFYFQVQKSPITSRILITFAGSAGHGSISSADIRVTHPDGKVGTGIILPLKGVNEIILDGSKESDRVEIIAHMTSGETYRVYDELVPF